MYKTILVPHGGTLAGDEAIKHAINLAKPYSAKIIILHVVEPMPIPSDVVLSDSQQQILQKDIDEANKVIKKAMEEKLELHVVKAQNEQISAEKKITIGNPAEEILKTATEFNIDLIVIPKRKKLKDDKKLLAIGDISRKILDNATCPIYLIDVENIH